MKRLRDRVPTMAALAAGIVAGPTRTWTVPMAYTLPAGTRLLSTHLMLGATGPKPVFAGAPGVSLGIVGNAINVHADTALSNATELGAGIAAAAASPWRGSLDVEGKQAIMREGRGGAPLSLAAQAGAIFSVNANGVPDLGLQLSVPISKLIPLSNGSPMIFSLAPSWNFGAQGARGSKPLTPLNQLGLGFGLDLPLSPSTDFLVDTNLGLKLGGLQTDSTVGFRYGFSPDFMGEVFLGVGAGGLGAGANGLGVGAIARM